MYRGYKEQTGNLSWSVESMCKILTQEYGTSISVSGYYDFKKRLPSKRSIRDAELKEAIVAIYIDNYSCYGQQKIYKELRKMGYQVARCTVVAS